MDHAQQLPRAFPWRSAAVVTATIAAVELVALIAGGTALLARPVHHAAAKPVRTTAGAAARPVFRVPAAAKVPSVPLRPRSYVAVLVLNGNGVQGAAGTEAARLQGLGYRIGGAKNAVRHDYARSMVLYVPGYLKEARRLGHDAGVRLIAPVDGLRAAQLKGSQLVVVLGGS